MCKTKSSILLATPAIILMLVGCSNGPTDKHISDAVISLYQGASRNTFGHNVKFNDRFSIQSVSIKDRLVSDKKMTVMCTVQVKVLRNVHFEPGMADLGCLAYDDLLDPQTTAKAGEVLSREVKFVFHKFESGWRILNPKGNEDPNQP